MLRYSAPQTFTRTVTRNPADYAAEVLPGTVPASIGYYGSHHVRVTVVRIKKLRRRGDTLTMVLPSGYFSDSVLNTRAKDTLWYEIAPGEFAFIGSPADAAAQLKRWGFRFSTLARHLKRKAPATIHMKEETNPFPGDL